MGGLGWPEILIILVIVLLLFGAKKLPELARSLGKSINEFKKGKDEGTTAAADNTPKTDVKSNTQDGNQQKSA